MGDGFVMGSILGDAGDDSFTIGAAAETIVGGDGRDRIYVSGPAGVRLTLGNMTGLAQDTFARANYLAEYNGLLDQVVDLAKDSGYNGKNLLEGEPRLTRGRAGAR